MKDKQHIIVVDPTAFAGGSKVATESILGLLGKQQRITVLTADSSSWKSDSIQRVKLYEPAWLALQEQGIGYFIRHAFIALQLLLIRLRLGPFDTAVGASGPGVDLALYLLRPVMKFKIIQLIHGPVAKSRTIARCLNAAHQVHYLQSSALSLKNALSTLAGNQVTLPANFLLLKNGLTDAQWPTTCQTHTPVIFWAASLLKWKGLETLIAALQSMTEHPRTHICYIKPKGVQLPVSDAPILMEMVNWHDNPDNIDQLRANSNIFVSTSKNEPFGLSILEAMAAGHCVVIPEDGAYWDLQLEHNINCVKYAADDPQDLSEKLLMLSNDLTLINSLGAQGRVVAQDYRAEKQYQQIVTCLSSHDIQKQIKNSATRSVT
ncbi:glycosyl transferase [Psychromonas marina]|uniref:Glycosyl transferase n=1 Tax=Psychromonas marina TaxID=88364 RepID=A0ABQ6E251_9GAMM|nr:glycosyltransferase family 4 protein [Psychromonas marina]GLS91283.1 glycosyl transferase [Psychromonas marina]